jgi:hypothetical protein
MIAQVIDKVRRPLVLSLVDGCFAFLQYSPDTKAFLCRLWASGCAGI